MANVPDKPSDGSGEQEFSLRTLSEAFAEALARQRAADGKPAETVAPDEEVAGGNAAGAATGGAQGTPADEATGAAVGPPPIEQQRPSDDDDSCPISPQTILEAMLFVGDSANRPLESQHAASLMRGVEPAEIPALVEELNASYEARGCPYRIASDGAGFRLALCPQYDWLREKFLGRIRLARLSQAAIDVLAIVAYRQPLAADEVSRLREKPSHHILSQLVRRRLLRVERSKEKPRKPLYRTTERFLELFDLRSLADLPESESLDPG
jgi:segregation and condensation protein B